MYMYGPLIYATVMKHPLDKAVHVAGFIVLMRTNVPSVHFNQKVVPLGTLEVVWLSCLLIVIRWCEYLVSWLVHVRALGTL